MPEGRREPRLSTPPLRPLTPETSKGFEVIDFARDVLGEPLFPWQEEAVIRLLELREDGRFRFRTVMILVGRQNGKTHLFRVLALWKMYVEGTPDGRSPEVLSAAQDLKIARDTWLKGVNMVLANPVLDAEKAGVRYANGEQELTLTNGALWRICATSRSAGRGMTIDMLFIDEIAQQHDEDAWAALVPTVTSRPDGMVVTVSNMGDDRSIVLNDQRAKALSGEYDDLCLLEWSAPEGCDLDDVEAWAMANPSMNLLYDQAVIQGQLANFSAAKFRTERLCQKVDALDAAIPLDAWNACADTGGSMESVRSRVVGCLDVAPDGQHVSFVVAATLPDGRVRIDVVAAWGSTDAMRNAIDEEHPSLYDLLARIKPRAWGWFPGGPAAALAAEFRKMQGACELKAGEVAAICQGLNEQAVSRRLLHQDDPLLNAQVSGVSRLPKGDGWVFSRRGGGHCDAVYAAAGALHLARSRPSAGKPWVVSA